MITILYVVLLATPAAIVYGFVQGYIGTRWPWTGAVFVVVFLLGMLWLFSGYATTSAWSRGLLPWQQEIEVILYVNVVALVGAFPGYRLGEKARRRDRMPVRSAARRRAYLTSDDWDEEPR